MATDLVINGDASAIELYLSAWLAKPKYEHAVELADKVAAPAIQAAAAATVLPDLTVPSPPTAAAVVGPDAADPLEILEAVLGSLDALADADWHAMPGKRQHEALDVAEQIDRRLGAIRSHILSTTEADGTWALMGPRTFQAWLRDRLATTSGAAAAQVRRARGLRNHLPLTDAALAAGEVGHEHVAVMVREAIKTEPLREQLQDTEVGEAFLVEHAKVMDAGTFTKLVRSWAIAADPEAADRAWRETDAKEELTISATLGGYHVAGWLDELSGRVVNAALDAHMSDRSAEDPRSPAQRRAGALVSLAHQALDSGTLTPHARIRPHLTVTTTWAAVRALAGAAGSAIPPWHGGAASDDAGPDKSASDGDDPDEPGTDDSDVPEKIHPQSTLTALGGPREDTDAPDASVDLFPLSPEAREWLQTWRSGDDHVISTAIDHESLVGVEPATFEDGTPIAPALLARLTCDSALARVVFGAESTVLDVGRERRIFPANMARAIFARDRHCQFPRCDEPPGFGEIHHSLQWYRDHGPTDVEHGILLCWHHHTWVHTHEMTIARVAGRWHFYDRHGRQLRAEPPQFRSSDP